MIEKIGLVYQDANSYGFLRGLCRRLHCVAELIPPPSAVGMSRNMTRNQAKRAWAYFRNKGVHLVLRFTDADAARWQQVQREELEVFPDEAESLLLCGVAVDNVEQWLALAPGYIADQLGISQRELEDPLHQTAKIKSQLIEIRSPHENASDVVARIVQNAPPDVFRTWLREHSLRRFYQDCRAAARRADCDVPNELEGAD